MHESNNSAVINQPTINTRRKVKRGTTVTNRKLRLDRPSEDALMTAVELLSGSGRDVYTIHPTAAPSNLFVNIPQATRLSIFNSSGMLVQTMQLAASQSISIQQLPKGMYHLQFQGAGKTVRFIKL